MTNVLNDVLGGAASAGSATTPGAIGLGSVASATAAPVQSVVGSAVTSAVSSAFSGLVQPIARVLLYIAFVGAGIVLVVLGLQRLTGAKPMPFPVPIPA